MGDWKEGVRNRINEKTKKPFTKDQFSWHEEAYYS
jgi:hypothetical protein